jgi:hypothetical protein
MNGRVICTWGVNGPGGVMSAILSWVKRDRQPDDEVSDDETIVESRWFTVGGIDHQTNDHGNWCEEPVQVGDEIRIRILGPGPANEPKESYKFGERSRAQRGAATVCGLPGQQSCVAAAADKLGC